MKTKGSTAKKNRFGTYTKDCPVLKGIINNIANKKMIPPAKIEEMVDFYHNWAYAALSCDMAPTLAVPNFGRFYLSPLKIRKKIFYIMQMKKDGRMSYEEAKEKIQRYYPLWKRSWWETMKRGKGIVRKNGERRKSLGNILRSRLCNKWREK